MDYLNKIKRRAKSNELEWCGQASMLGSHEPATEDGEDDDDEARWVFQRY